jgi:hypothetical protein
LHPVLFISSTTIPARPSGEAPCSTRTSPHLASMPPSQTLSTTPPCSSHCGPACTDDRRALRLCCSTMRDAVDAQTGCVEQGESSPVLCPATCARLHGVHTATLRSMDCLRRMLLVGGRRLPSPPVAAPSLGGSREANALPMQAPCVPDLGSAHSSSMQPAVHGRMDDHAHGRVAAMHGVGGTRACPAPPPLSATPCVLQPSVGCCCDRKSHGLRGHRQHSSLAHAPESGASGQRNRSATGDGSSASPSRRYTAIAVNRR